MTARLDIFGNPSGARVLKHLLGASRLIAASTLPGTTRELVAIRTSQINGCSFCVDMHTKDALAEGEAAHRVHLVAAWRETTVFTDAERAALQLAEEGTRTADAAGGVSDETWELATRHYDEEKLTALVTVIAVTNAFNRMNGMTLQPAGHYRPRQFA